MEAVKYRSSLIVPSVLELTKEKMNAVPPRYIRTHEEQITAVDSIETVLPTVPIIDVDALLSGSLEELERLDSACKHWGFFQVINHGVSTLLVENIKKEVHDFFNIKFEEKKKLWQQPGNNQGFGQHFVVSEEQKLDWSDMFFITTLPMILREPELFAKLPPPLRETLENYSLELQKLAITILGKMADALKIDAEEIKKLFDDGSQTMRLNYYPVCPQPEQVIGLTPHSDPGALTILLQLNETEGLQIRKNGKWVPVKPLANAFLVNIGDSLEIVTNGVYRSIEHRAMVNSSKERLSIATFYNAKLDAELGPAKSLISPTNPALFKTVLLEEYYKGFFARKLDGKSNIDFMRI